MSQTDPGPRPIEITVGGVVASGASLMLVVAVFDAMGQLRSVDTRAAITQSVTSGYTKGLGISVDQATSIIHGFLLVAGAAAAAAAVLGFFVLQRNRGARIALSVAAVPILLTSHYSQGFLSLLIVTGTALLWSRPARDWFAGRPQTPRPERIARETPVRPPVPPYRPPVPDVQVRPSDPDAPQPPPSQGWGVPTGPPAPGPAPYWPPPNPYARVPRTWVDGRPRSVVVACVLTWTFAGLTGVMFGSTSIALAANRSGFIKLMRQSPEWKASYADTLQGNTFVVTGAVVGLWCIAAVLLAVLVWRGVAWAWILLIVSTVLATVLSLYALPLSIPMFAVLAIALGRLLSPPTRVWFASRPPR
ncbi:MAG: hypothetical protein JWR52_2104 [Marmoricola sp.]|nr:hypothetical protein [Marmoricola sp.]